MAATATPALDLDGERLEAEGARTTVRRTGAAGPDTSAGVRWRPLTSVHVYPGQTRFLGVLGWYSPSRRCRHSAGMCDKKNGSAVDEPMGSSPHQGSRRHDGERPWRGRRDGGDDSRAHEPEGPRDEWVLTRVGDAMRLQRHRVGHFQSLVVSRDVSPVTSRERGQERRGPANDACRRLLSVRARSGGNGWPSRSM